MNPERLKKLQAQAALVRIGGKGTPRRKKKIVHQSTATDDKKLQSTLKKLAVNSIQGIEEVNMYKNDGTVIHFNNPRTQASLSSNTFAITGHADVKNIAEMLKQLGGGLGGDPDTVKNLKQMAKSLAANSRVLSTLDEDDIPDLVQNFESQLTAGGSSEINIDDAIKATKVPTEVVD